MNGWKPWSMSIKTEVVFCQNKYLSKDYLIFLNPRTTTVGSGGGTSFKRFVTNFPQENLGRYT